MNQGIFQTVVESDKAFSKFDHSEATSEQPTLADLVLPGSGHSFSDEFACLLRILGAGEVA